MNVKSNSQLVEAKAHLDLGRLLQKDRNGNSGRFIEKLMRSNLSVFEKIKTIKKYVRIEEGKGTPSKKFTRLPALKACRS